MSTVRKNITLPGDLYDQISVIAKKRGLSFSAFLRNTIDEVLQKKEQEDLLEYLNANCEYVDDEEQAEFDAMDFDSKTFEFKKMTLDDILQD
jgi:metal-responsive CopG/Arc/MetJ family transcriptional regulator